MTPYPNAVQDHPVLRQSLLANVNECHLKTAFGLRLSLAEPDGGPTRSGWSTHRQMGGRTAHHALNQILREIMDRKPDDKRDFGPEMAVEIVNDALALRWSDPDEIGSLSVFEMDLTRKAVRKWAKDNTFSVQDLVAVEERLEVVVHYPENPDDLNDDRVVERTLTGQPDVLLIDPHGDAVVIDWKFTWALPSKSHADDEEHEDGDKDISKAGFFQQRFYALLVFMHYRGVRSVTLREFYAFRSETREATIYRWQLPDLVVEMAALAEVFDRLYETMPPSTAGKDAAEAARAVLALLDDGRRVGRSTPAVQELRAVVEGEALPPLYDVWKPTPGVHCRFCPLAQNCPVPSEARGIASPEEALAAAGAMFIGGRVQKNNRERVEAWCADNGPLRVVDGKRVRYLGHVVATRTERPTRRQVDQAIARGEDPRDLFRTKTHTTFREFSPAFGDGDPDDYFTDDEVREAFERAVAAAEDRRRRGGRQAA